MSRLALLAGLLSASLPALANYPSEKQLRAEIAIYVEALCRQHADSCDQARIVLSGYEDMLEKTRVCENAKSGDCKGTKVFSLNGDVELLDKATAKLPGVDGFIENALLRASALCTKRLATVAARLKQPHLVSGSWDEDSAAPKVLEQACIEKQANCEKLRRAYNEAKTLKGQIAACQAAACDYGTIDPLVERSHAAMLLTLDKPPGAKVDTIKVFVYANKRANDAVALLAALVDRLLEELKTVGDAFEAKVAAAENSDASQAANLPGEAQALTQRYQEASFATDRLMLRLGYERAGAKRDAVNAQTTRLTALRGRARAVLIARGINVDAADAGVVAGATAGSAVTAGAGQKANTVTVTAKLGPWRPTLLDNRTVPPALASTPPPPIAPGNFGHPHNLIRLYAGNELEQADAKRRLGRTTTVGNPGAYSRLVYAQATGESCSVAAQVQVLRAHGLLPASGDPQAQELELIAEAEKRGFKSAGGGTAPEFSGGLLLAKGLLVTKHQGSSWPDFEAAVRRGAVLQVGVDASHLWKIGGGQRLSHSILVTGGEVETGTGKLLGVYINDTGDDPPRGGRFVTVTDMKKAWTGNFAEIR